MSEKFIVALRYCAEGVGFCPQALLAAAEAVASANHMNEERFRAFYERTARPLWAYLAKASRSRDVADDLLQESYCRFLSATLPEMDDAEAKSYLFRIATNLLHDRWRREGREQTVEVVPEAHERDPLAHAEVRKAFDALKPRERLLLWLAYVEGSSHKEIAAITGLGANSIRPMLFRARQKLADVLREFSGGAGKEAAT